MTRNPLSLEEKELLNVILVCGPTIQTIIAINPAKDTPTKKCE